MFIGLFVITVLATGARADEPSTSPDGFKQIKVAPGLAQAHHLIDTIGPFLLDHPQSLEGRASVDMTIGKKGNGFSVNIKKTGFLDDSVRGEHWRCYVIRNTKGGWQLISMGIKYICYRSKSADGRCS